MSTPPPIEPTTPITLVSSQGDEFIVEYDLLRASGVLSRLFASSEANFDEQRTRVVKLRQVPTSALQKIIEYCEYRRAHEHSNKAPPKFEIQGSEASDLLMAANFLDV